MQDLAKRPQATYGSNTSRLDDVIDVKMMFKRSCQQLVNAMTSYIRNFSEKNSGSTPHIGRIALNYVVLYTREGQNRNIYQNWSFQLGEIINGMGS